MLCALAACSAPPPYLATPQPIQAAGAWVHAASGMTLPASLAGFYRVAMARFGAATPDVSASYVNPGVEGAIEITLSLRPAPDPPTLGLSAEAASVVRTNACRDTFADRVGEFSRVARSAPDQQGSVSVRRNGRLRQGRRAVFVYDTRFDGRMQRVHTELERFCEPGMAWTLERAATWPAAYDGAPLVAAFDGALVWTGDLSATP